MYRIRFHGRGGQGIKTASRILGTAFFREGFEVQDAPVYGAERRGAPMFAYVRAARAPIKERGAVTHPDLVVVADETVVAVPAANVLLGVSPRTVLLINSAEPEGVWKERLKVDAAIVALPVSVEVTERAELPHVGAMCAGAAARLLGEISREMLAQAIREELGPLGEEIVADNLEHALASFDALAPHAGCVREGGEIAAAAYTTPRWIDLPFEEAHLSAPDIFAAATSVEVRTGLWRTLRPVIDYERCNRCAWVCSTLCPDSAIRVATDGTPEIDYEHCKGCMICVAVCPPHAIQAVPEREAQAAEAAGGEP